MAYLPQSQSEDSKEQGTSSGTDQVVGAQTAGGSGFVGGGPQSGPQPTSGGNANGSPGYTNLQSYLDANQGANSAKLGSDISNKADQVVGQARNDLQGNQSDFNNQVQSNTVQQDQAVLGNVQNNAEKVTADPNQAASFQKQYNANYSGPKSLSDISGYTNTAQDYQNANQYVDNTKDDQGRYTLLQNTYQNAPREGSQGYSAGENTLDNFLLGQSQQGQQAVQGIQQRYQGLGQELGSANTQAQQAAAAATQTDAATKAAAQAALNSGYGTLQTSLGAEVQAQNAARKQAYQDEVNAYANDGRYGQAGVNVSPYLTYGGDLTTNQAATSQDFQRYGALQQLAGGTLSPLLNGTAPAAAQAAYNLNQAGLTGAEQAALGGLNSSYSAPLAAARAAEEAHYQALVNEMNHVNSGHFDTSKYIQRDVDPGLGNIISQPDLTRYNALASLLGQSALSPIKQVGNAIDTNGMSAAEKAWEAAHPYVPPTARPNFNEDPAQMSNLQNAGLAAATGGNSSLPKLNQFATQGLRNPDVDSISNSLSRI